MKEFLYTIKDEIGIHARPAGKLVNILKAVNSQITIECKGKKADAKKIFSILSLAAKSGDEIKVLIEGEDEEETLKLIKTYLEKNL